jgi:hypothetical protein
VAVDRSTWEPQQGGMMRGQSHPFLQMRLLRQQRRHARTGMVAAPDTLKVYLFLQEHLAGAI